MEHDRAWLRAKSWTKAIRKRNIDIERQIPDMFGNKHLYYNNLHQYSKNKIHCSCPLCATKTNSKHNRYNPSINWSISDRRKIEEFNEQIEEEEIFDYEEKL